ncbi:MAG TPA: hypothetical protein VMU42_14425, partial [Candidatus Sulfotelmatobacter sp.]|nr:hypothetical protein [Candidatus Sulfotelmatobacter sp.]
MQTSSRAGMARRAEVFRGLGLDAAAREHGAGYRVTHRGFFGGFAEGATRQSGTLRGTSQMFRGLFGEGEGGAAAGGGFAGGFAGSVAGSVAVMAAQKAWGMMKGYVGAVADEAKAIDSLQRRTGDLGGSFTGLMQQVHKASDGLGVTYAEASKLGNALAKVSGGFQGGDLRSAIGFARATGMDLGRSVDFFGTMRRVGDIGSGESEMKRFAYLIGQAVTASGYSGQVEEITKAVAAYATTSARFGLSSPNFGGYLGALTGLTRTGIPGLDPEGAAAMLSRADATIRAGGAGRWSQAFLMQALGGRIGDPYAARAIWQQGIFGSSAGAFSGPWADMVRQFGGRVPAGTMTTNFAAIRSAFDRVFAGTGTAAPAAFTQLFGLQSDAQGAALHNMRPAAFDNLMHSLQRNGVKMSDV